MVGGCDCYSIGGRRYGRGSDHNPNSNSLGAYRIGGGSDLNPWEGGSAECGRG